MTISDWIPWVVLLVVFVPQVIGGLLSAIRKSPEPIDESTRMAATNEVNATANTALIKNTGAVVDMVMAQANSLKAELADLRERMDKVEVRERVHRRWNEMLSRQVIQLGGKPITYEQAAREAGVPMAMFESAYTDLRREIVKAFDKGELDLLARDVGLDPNEITGESLSERAAELVSMATRRRMMKRLQEEIHKARPEFLADVLDLI